jgi:hypothetical protein
MAYLTDIKGGFSLLWAVIYRSSYAAGMDTNLVIPFGIAMLRTIRLMRLFLHVFKNIFTVCWIN